MINQEKKKNLICAYCRNEKSMFRFYSVCMFLAWPVRRMGLGNHKGISIMLRAAFERGLRGPADFFKSEDGLVTVEWVALAGALFVGAITVGWIVMNGLQAPANTIGNGITSCEAAAAQAAGSTSNCK
ncbi:MAG: hypothetical protein KGJ78_14820 [Alphaproteobacteria bacterium]|nr:hypothetical protein [Alphaproteobacteria bacterium]